MGCHSPSEFRAKLRRFKVFEPSPVVLVSERPTGPLVSLDEYRADMAKSRVESLGKPGLYLDQSETGAGKTHADMAAFRLAGRSLSIQPTHKNCEEVVKQLCEAGLDAVAFPGRFATGLGQNCWNDNADAAEAMSLSVAAAICPHCPAKKRCLETGYLAALARAKAARVAVATHARAIHTGLAALSEGRDFASIHEDVANVLLPQSKIPARSLVVARDVLHRVLNDPHWRDQFRNATTVDDDGETVITDEKKTALRDQQDQFLRLLADVCDGLLATAATTDAAKNYVPTTTMHKPSGIENVLFRASRECKADFCRKPVWSALLTVSTGEFLRIGVLNYERTTTDIATSRPAGEQDDSGDDAESPERDSDALVE